MVSAKVLLIGIDGADRTLLRKWTVSGDLPHLAELHRQGVAVDLATREGLADDAVWSSLYSGTDVDAHGRFHWRQLQQGSYELANARERTLRPPPFWQALSEAGRRVAVIDAPKSPLVTNLNGMQITNWLVHGQDRPKFPTYPAGLAAQLTESYGAAPAQFCSTEVPIWGAREYQVWAEALRSSLAMKKTASLDFLAQENWDLFFTVFKEAHCCGHHFWHLNDPFHHAHNAKLGDAFGGVLKRDLRVH